MNDADHITSPAESNETIDNSPEFHQMLFGKFVPDSSQAVSSHVRQNVPPKMAIVSNKYFERVICSNFCDFC